LPGAGLKSGWSMLVGGHIAGCAAHVASDPR
jgi:hypothetical protein